MRKAVKTRDRGLALSSYSSSGVSELCIDGRSITDATRRTYGVVSCARPDAFQEWNSSVNWRQSMKTHLSYIPQEPAEVGKSARVRPLDASTVSRRDYHDED